jgi:hypothetical protein
MMPGVRAVLEAYHTFRNADGLVEGPATGWNFVDWVPAWKNGVPPDADSGVSAVVNWQFVHALRLARDLEAWCGEPEMATRWDRTSRQIAAAISDTFWEPVRRLFADDRQRTRFSEHAQCLAILSGLLDEDRLPQVSAALLNNAELTRTTIYFSHYLFEAYLAIGPSAQDALFARLGLWFDLKKQGFVTPFEEPEPSRSDCHGWGSHPLFHYFATVLGVRPAAPGFASVDISPLLGPVEHVSGRMPHPEGVVEVDLRRANEGVRGIVTLPIGVSGRFRRAGQVVTLRGGANEVTL